MCAGLESAHNGALLFVNEITYRFAIDGRDTADLSVSGSAVNVFVACNEERRLIKEYETGRRALAQKIENPTKLKSFAGFSP
ncbi:MAG: hypothetical protein ABIR96_03590 [Bdellovibrionota bacterium]